MVNEVPYLAHVLHFFVRNIKLIAIRHSCPVNLKIVLSHLTVTENPELLSTLRLRKECVNSLTEAKKKKISSLGGIYNSQTFMLQ
jgi:hypothetical protein